jgi:hypothetical protein
MSKVTRINPKDTDFLEIVIGKNGVPMVLDDQGFRHEPHDGKKTERGEYVFLWNSFRKPRWRSYDGGPKEAA